MIKKFKDYFSIEKIIDRVVEGLNSPLEINWNKNENFWKGSFNIDDINYLIEIENFSEKGHWLFKFRTEEKNYELINDIKKAFSTIPTIEKACIDFISEVKPEILVFSATDDSEGRKKLYTLFCHKIEKEFNMIYYTEKKEKMQLFILHKENYDGVEFSLSLRKMIKFMQN